MLSWLGAPKSTPKEDDESMVYPRHRSRIVWLKGLGREKVLKRGVMADESNPDEPSLEGAELIRDGAQLM